MKHTQACLDPAVYSREQECVVFPALLKVTTSQRHTCCFHEDPVDVTAQILALRPVHTGTNIGARYSPAFFNAFFVFTPKRFSLTMSRVNMLIHSLTLDGA